MYRRRKVTVPNFGTLAGKVLQKLPLVQVGICMHLEFFGNRESGKEDIFFQVQDLYLIHHRLCILQRFRDITEQFRHFLRGLEIELVVREFETAVLDLHLIIYKIIKTRCTLFFAGIDAEQDIVCIGIVAVYIVTIVGSDHRHFVFLREPDQGIIDQFLLFDIMTLQFNIIILAEHIQPPFEFLFCSRFSIV